MWLAGGSLAAVLLLAGIAWALKLGEPGRIADAGEARRLAEDWLSAFEAGDAVVGADGGGAVVFGDAGSVALIRASGARFIVREVRAPRWRLSPEGLIVEAGDPIPVRLALDHAAATAVGARLDALADTGVSSMRA